MKKSKILLSLALSAALFAGCGANQDMISADRAKEIALSHAGLSANEATFVKAELETEDGKKVYEVEFYGKDNTEYDYLIDAANGDVISFDADAEMYTPPASSTAAPADTAIDETKAKELILEKVPGAADADIREFRADTEDGKQVFEGKIIFNNTEYDFEIDAATGEFIKWEQEPVTD